MGSTALYVGERWLDPSQQVDGSIVVGIIFIATRKALEICLRFPVVLMDETTLGTSLTGVPGVYGDKLATSTFSLVRQLPKPF